MQCFDTFRGFLQKLHAGDNGREGSNGHLYFFSRRLGGRQPGAGHREQGAAAPCHPAGDACVQRQSLRDSHCTVSCIPNSKVDNAPIWAPVLSLQLVSAFLCQLVPLQFYLMRGLIFYITSIFYTFIIAVLTTYSEACTYTFLLCVHNHSISHNNHMQCRWF